MRGLGLNFATMREIVAGEARSGPWMSMERSVLHHFSDTMQIESLWRFNKKYDPAWVPRSAITGPYLRLAGTGLAIARAEAVTEIPVVGRLLQSAKPSAPSRGTRPVCPAGRKRPAGWAERADRGPHGTL